MALQESFPNLPISVQVLDGMPLAQQAAVYSNASIVIQAHGAALGKPSLCHFLKGQPLLLEELNIWGPPSCSSGTMLNIALHYSPKLLNQTSLHLILPSSSFQRSLTAIRFLLSQMVHVLTFHKTCFVGTHALFRSHGSYI